MGAWGSSPRFHRPNRDVYVTVHSFTERGRILHRHLQEWREIKDRARGTTQGGAFSLRDAPTP